MPLTPKQKHQLDEFGWRKLDPAPGLEFIDELRERIEELFRAEGERAGAEFKQEPGCRRLANLADKGEVFHRAATWLPLLECVAHVLGREFKISSLNARSVNPNWQNVQPLHADQGAVPDDKGYWVCNSVWMLDDFTEENGAIRIIPGSHQWGKLPQNVLDDPTAPHPDEILLTGRRGTIVVMNAHLWHGGTANRTARPRTAFHAFFVRRDKPQQQYQKKLIRPEVQESVLPQLRWLLALDDPLNDELCEQEGVRSGFLR